jgi:hypothetical protein
MAYVLRLKVRLLNNLIYAARSSVKYVPLRGGG